MCCIEYGIVIRQTLSNNAFTNKYASVLGWEVCESASVAKYTDLLYIFTSSTTIGANKLKKLHNISRFGRSNLIERVILSSTSLAGIREVSISFTNKRNKTKRQ